MSRWLLVLLLITTTVARADVLDRWVQYAPGGLVLARALTSEQACPALIVDGSPLAMQPRFPVSAAFPVRLCEARLPVASGTALLDGAALRLPRPHPARIVVVGDTGCRLKGTTIQGCNDPAAFPLARVATLAATFNPDLIVHVGDYYYRESPCPPGRQDCAGSPYGDTWASWNADFLTPASALLAAAPVVLTRGNHESCGRGAQGWFRLLDPRPWDAAAADCASGSDYDFTPSYTVPIGGAALLVHDSSYANDFRIDARTAERYRADIQAALAALGGPAILVTHKPVYGLMAQAASGPSAVLSGGNATEQQVFARGVPAPIRLLLSGHIHNFQSADLGGDYAPQLVVGDSGTALDPRFVPDPPADATFSTAPGGHAVVRGAKDLAEFGFLVMDADEAGFAARLYDLAGNPVARCAIRMQGARAIACD
jgi:predicted MPP superfamily phosphohydrolase